MQFTVAYKSCLTKFKYCYDAPFPLRERKERPRKIRKQGNTDELYKRIREKICNYHAFIYNRDPALLDELKTFGNKLNSDF